MRTTVAAVVVALAVLGGAVLPATATVGTLSLGDGGDDVGLVGGSAEEATPSSASAGAVAQSDDGNVSPGERLSGVVGVQGTELGTEVAERRLAVALNASVTDRGKATVVAREVEQMRDRLDTLRERRATLRAALQNGSIGPGEFRAKMAVLAANVSGTQRILNASAAAANDLPAAQLEAAGVNVTAIDRLRENASELSGPEVAEIARSIGGPDTGKQIGRPADAGNASEGNRGPPGDVNESGPPDDAGTDDETNRGQGRDEAPSGNETAPGSDASDGQKGNDGNDAGNGDENRPDDAPGGDGGTDTTAPGGDDDEAPTTTPDGGSDAGSGDY